MMDDISVVNRERWNALATANVMHSRPFFDFTPEQAAAYVSCGGLVTNLAGKQVLCLASGGGQDSVAFGLLGARVTVLDLSNVQLERDQQAATHHRLCFEIVPGDMRDLSMFRDGQFDVVWQAYSINYVSEVEPVFREVARVLKAGGIYRVTIANPFTLALSSDREEHGYPLRGPYRDGEEVTHYVPWEVEQADGSVMVLDGPRQFRHTLGTTLNTLVKHGFVFWQLHEWMRPKENPALGTWAHFTQAAPPYLDILCRLGVTHEIQATRETLASDRSSSTDRST